MLSYLRTLRPGIMLLWCYLIWYLAMLRFYFDPRPSLWINSLGISVVIGTGLILSVMPVGGPRAMEKWAVARLFLMPFAVSSFAALIKDHGFTVIFSPSLGENAIAAMLEPHEAAAALKVSGVFSLQDSDQALAVLARLGFRQIGLARSYLFIDGAWRDHVLAARLNPAFDASIFNARLFRPA